MQKISQLILSGLLLLGLPSTRNPKNPSDKTSSIEIDDKAYFETELFNLVNVKRTELELSSLITNTLLKNVAQDHSLDMATQNFLAHGNLIGDHASQRLTKAGYDYYYWGEIIAGGSTTPQTVIDGWFNSPKHKEILIDPSFTEVGIGYIYKPDTKHGHYWTVILAIPR